MGGVPVVVSAVAVEEEFVSPELKAAAAGGDSDSEVVSWWDSPDATYSCCNGESQKD